MLPPRLRVPRRARPVPPAGARAVAAALALPAATPGARHDCGLGQFFEQLRPARIASPGLARQLRDQRAAGAVGQPFEHGSMTSGSGSSAMRGTRAAQFARRLRAAQQQLAHDRGFLRRELEAAELGVAEDLLILRYAAAESGFLHHHVAARESVDDELHRGLVELHQRFAVALLIARVDERIQRQWVLVGRRDLLFDERADDARLDCRQSDVHARSILGVCHAVCSPTSSCSWSPACCCSCRCRFRRPSGPHHRECRPHAAVLPRDAGRDARVLRDDPAFDGCAAVRVRRPDRRRRGISQRGDPAAVGAAMHLGRRDRRMRSASSARSRCTRCSSAARLARWHRALRRSRSRSACIAILPRAPCDG